MNWIRFSRRLTWVAMLSIGLPFGILTEAAQAKKNVLVIHSYHPELSWTAALKRGIDQAFPTESTAEEINRNSILPVNEQPLASGDDNVQLWHEFLDAKRYPKLNHKKDFFQQLQAKYSETDLDLIIVSDDPGLNAVMSERDTYFPDLPIVFLGINTVRPEVLNLANATGVFEFHAQEETIVEAIRQTNSEGIIFLADSSASSTGHVEKLRDLRQASGEPIKVEVVTDLIPENITNEFASYPGHWPVFMLGQLRQNTADRALISFEQSSRLLREQINNPLYSSGFTHLNNGVVGGKILDGEHHAKQAVELVRQVLDGTPVDSLAPIIEAETTWIFDAQELKRLNISIEDLPTSTVLINNPPSFYQENRGLIWLNVAALTGAMTIIALLVEVIRRRAIAARILQTNHQRYEDIATLGATVFWEIDAEMKFTYVSGDTSAFNGLTPEQLLGQTLGSIVAHHPRLDFDWDGFVAAFEDHQPICNFTFRAHQEARAIRVFQLSGKPIFDEREQFQGYRGVKREITEQLYLAETLAYQATYDSLTGLINRQEFDLRLKTAVQRVQRYKTQIVLCYLDLDQFKIVNDTAGHLVGDQLLAELSQVIQQSVRGADDLGRLGGDEFGLLLEGCSISQANQICENIIERVRAYRFRWENRQFQVGVSIGIIPIQADGSDAVSLLSRADLACYKAKDLGRGRIYSTTAQDVALTTRQTQMVHLANVPRAIEENRFYLMQQPIQAIVPISKVGQTAGAERAVVHPDQLSSTTHFEVLLRLRDEQGRSVSPGLFIPEAERYGVIGMIDRWVLKTVLQRGAPFCHQPGDLISVNLSGASINDERFLIEALDWLDASPLAPHYLCFEITETAAISHLDQAKSFIYAMKDVGAKFALDDFGSGLSSFGYLRELPVDFLKIDGSLVKKIHLDPCDRAMVALINDIAHMMGMETIAEFVENDQILRCLEEIGVDYAQGYGIGKPEPLDFSLMATR